MTETATDADNRIRTRREELGLGRSGLAELTGLTPAKLWRAEMGRPTGDELEALNAMLERLERDGLPPEMTPRRKPGEPKVRRRTRAELETMLADVCGLVAEAGDVKTARDLRAVLGKIREIVTEPVVNDVEL